MHSSPGARRASRERVFRELLARQEHARASAREWKARAWRFLLLSLALVGLWWWTWWGWMLVAAVVAGLGAMRCWEQSARDMAEGRFDVCAILEPEEDLP